MDNGAGDRVQGLVSEAWTLLDEARPGEAALLFGRVLLQDPVHEEARRGLLLSRARAGEVERELDVRLDDARAAVAEGDPAQARAMLEDVIRLGGDRDRAHAMLDRLDARGGLVAEGSPSVPREAVPVPLVSGEPAHRVWWTRTAFATACGVAFAAVTTTVAASWETMIGRLERRPLPAAYSAAAATLPAPPAGELALSAARQRLENGDVAGALSALGHIGPDDPVYPFALQLRQQAEQRRPRP
jgi:hypothetical protein